MFAVLAAKFPKLIPALKTKTNVTVKSSPSNLAVIGGSISAVHKSNELLPHMETGKYRKMVGGPTEGQGSGNQEYSTVKCEIDEKSRSPEMDRVSTIPSVIPIHVKESSIVEIAHTTETTETELTPNNGKQPLSASRDSQKQKSVGEGQPRQRIVKRAVKSTRKREPTAANLAAPTTETATAEAAIAKADEKPAVDVSINTAPVQPVAPVADSTPVKAEAPKIKTAGNARRTPADVSPEVSFPNNNTAVDPFMSICNFDLKVSDEEDSSVCSPVGKPANAEMPPEADEAKVNPNLAEKFAALHQYEPLYNVREAVLPLYTGENNEDVVLVIRMHIKSVLKQYNNELPAAAEVVDQQGGVDKVVLQEKLAGAEGISISDGTTIGSLSDCAVTDLHGPMTVEELAIPSDVEEHESVSPTVERVSEDETNHGHEDVFHGSVATSMDEVPPVEELPSYDDSILSDSVSSAAQMVLSLTTHYSTSSASSRSSSPFTNKIEILSLENAPAVKDETTEYMASEVSNAIAISVLKAEPTNSELWDELSEVKSEVSCLRQAISALERQLTSYVSSQIPKGGPINSGASLLVIDDSLNSTASCEVTSAIRALEKQGTLRALTAHAARRTGKRHCTTPMYDMTPVTSDAAPVFSVYELATEDPTSSSEDETAGATIPPPNTPSKPNGTKGLRSRTRTINPRQRAVGAEVGTPLTPVPTPERADSSGNFSVPMCGPRAASSDEFVAYKPTRKDIESLYRAIRQTKSASNVTSPILTAGSYESQIGIEESDFSGVHRDKEAYGTAYCQTCDALPMRSRTRCPSNYQGVGHSNACGGRVSANTLLAPGFEGMMSNSSSCVYFGMFTQLPVTGIPLNPELFAKEYNEFQQFQAYRRTVAAKAGMGKRESFFGRSMARANRRRV